MDYSVLSDPLLVDLFRTGDKAAFEQIYRKYGYELLRTARKKLNSQENAEEIVQEIFVDLWERREAIQIDELKSYLFGAVKYKVFNQLKALINRQRYEEYTSTFFSGADHGTENRLAYEDLTKAIEEAIAQLPQKTQLIFRLNRLEHQSVRQISAKLQIPERTVEYHITQSLRTLRYHLQEFVLSLVLLVTLN